MKIRVKLIIAFMSLMIVGAIVGVIGLWGVVQVSQEDQALLNHQVRNLVLSNTLEASFLSVQVNSRDLVAAETPARRDVFQANVQKRLREFSQALQSLSENTVTPEEKQLYQAVKTDFDAYKADVAKAMELVQDSKPQQAEALILGPQKELAQKIYKELQSLTSSQQQSAQASSAQTQALTHFILTLLIAVLVAAFLLSFFVGLLLARSIALPMKNLVKVAGDVASGDLGTHFPDGLSKRRDELGQLGKSMAKMLESLKENVSLALRVSDELGLISRDLQSNMSQTGAAVNHIVTSVDKVGRFVLDQSASVTETTATSEQIVKNLESLDNLIADQSANVTQSSASIEQMLSNIQSVNANMKKLGQAFSQLVQFSDEGRKKLDGVLTVIREVANHSEKLQEANSVINSIAAQTNLLAMNAAIEAAHAGDAGKGFSVVADEIRKLAEISSTQSRQIAGDVKTMQGQIQTATGVSSEADEAFRSILEQLDILGRLEHEITSAMDEQNEGSKQVLVATEQITSITSQVRNNSAEMLEGSRAIHGEMSKLLVVTEEVRQNVGEIQDETNSIHSVVLQIEGLSTQNAEAADKLQKRMEVFKLS
jgi:methyl-accepting chemotaxis protein